MLNQNMIFTLSLIYCGDCKICKNADRMTLNQILAYHACCSHNASYVYIHILAGRLPSAGFCYCKSHNSESAPASFDVCELVATEGSCYNDAEFKVDC